MAPFDTKYAGARRVAIYHARFEQGLTYKAIKEKAAAGELVAGDAFEIPLDYVGDLCRAEEHRRAGRFNSPLADKPHRDAIEDLRRGLIGAADDLLTDYRVIAKKTPAKADPERLRAIIRCVREAASLPEPKDLAPDKPGSNAAGQRTEGTTRTGPAGALLAAMRGSTTSDTSDKPRITEPAPSEPSGDTHIKRDQGSETGSLTSESSTARAA